MLEHYSLKIRLLKDYKIITLSWAGSDLWESKVAEFEISGEATLIGAWYEGNRK